MTIFDQFACYYDLLYRDKNYTAEADYIAETLHLFAPQAVRLLEFGSGTGIHGRLLAQKGYHVTGVERSSEMVALANQNSLLHSRTDPGSFTCFQGDIRHTQVEDKFDAVIALFHVISYQTSNEDLLATFQNASRHLKKDGLLLFDIWYTPAVLGQRPSVRVKCMEDEQVRLDRIAEPVMRPNENIVDVYYTIYIEEKSTKHISRLTEVHPMRYFTQPELELIAAQTGFTSLHYEEFLTGKEPGEDTWGVCCVWRVV